MSSNEAPLNSAQEAAIPQVHYLVGRQTDYLVGRHSPLDRLDYLVGQPLL